VKKYYSLEVNNREADIQIYGEITAWPWLESDVSSYLLSKQIEALNGVDTINVYINSPGGDVSEGWAIYNALRRHPAQIHTFADGLVCSIASVIFESGDERTMMNPSALMIHQPLVQVKGNASKLRKEAETLDTLGKLSAEVYQRRVNISEDELAKMLDAETWIAPEDAVSMGFATDVAKESESGGVSQSALPSLIAQLTKVPTAASVPTAIDGDALAEKTATKVVEKLQAAAKNNAPAANGLLNLMSAL